MHKIEDIIKKLPNDAGVYQYFNREGKLLYIGKAKVLSNRVKSYWLLTPYIRARHLPTTRIGKMLAEAKYLDYIVVSSEEDALILENSLIKQLKPKYNILLRDDKTYPYIYIDEMQDFPRFEITRKVVKSPKVKYYGPFPTGAKALLDAIYDFFPLVQKKSCINGKKACLFYEIKKCLAPCEGKISKKEYATIIKDAKYAISNRKVLIDKMSERMLKLASNERFEEAANLRDSIEKIRALQMKSTIDIVSSANYDIFAIDSNSSRAILVKIFMREGKIISSTHKLFKNIDNFNRDDAYKQALIDHYKNLITLDLNTILVAHEFEDRELIAEVISKIADKKIYLQYPKVGNKAKLTNLAIKNTTELLKQNLNSDDISIENKLKELLSLELAPYRVECFDNSHMMGEATVGAMIVWDSKKFDKSSYRKYELEAKDEYAQMRETLTRRVQSFKKVSPPDLWLIDGGATLLKLAIEILENAKVNLDVVAIAKEKLDNKAHRAKGAARDIIYTQNGEIFELKTTDKRLNFLQKLRDEAHRFAISYHRQKKQKNDMNLTIYEHKGIGKQIVIKLLNYFGTFEAIESASYEEIAQITNKKVAFALKKPKSVKSVIN